MPGLPATGELSYNGIEFDGATHITVGVEFVYDEAGRTVIAHKHLITVTAIVADNDGLDVTLEDIRRKLGEAGGKLRFINKGFGKDLKITSAGRLRDVTSGPNPKELSWVPLGDDKSAQIVWSVEVTVAMCRSPAGARVLGVMALNYSTTYSIDEHGDTTRTLAGYIQIAQNVVNRRPRDTADRYRDHFAPRGLAGFKRQQEWALNFAHSRVDFVITDAQIPSPNPYPVGIVNIDARHRVSWRRGRNGLRYFNTISATISPEARLSGAQAWGVFLSIVIKRMTTSVRRGKSIFLEALEVEEGIFTRNHNFSATYRFLSSIQDFIGDSGLWTPFRENNWEAWTASLDNSMFHPRGNRRLRDIPGNDVIMSLCESPAAVAVNNQQRFQNFVTPVSSPGVASPGLRNVRPPPEQSYMEYDSVIIPEQRQPAVQQSILQEVEDLAPAQWLLETPLNPPGKFSLPVSNTIPDVIQVGSSASYRVRLVGHAKRAGYEIPKPAIVKWGTQSVTLVRGIFPQRVVGNFFGIPVFEAMWDIEYLVGSSPGTVGPLSDPHENVNAPLGTASVPLGTTT